MRCTFRRLSLSAVMCTIFVLCLLRGRAPPSPRLRQQRMREAQTKVDQAMLGAEVHRSFGNISKASARQVVEQLLAAALQHGRALTVLQVGACDGAWKDTNDPVQPLLTNEAVRGLLLEPVPPQWEELKARVMALPAADGRLLAVNAALCPAGGAKSLPFYTVSARYAIDNPNAPHWAKKEIGSLLRSHLEKHKVPAEYIEEIPVPCRTAAEVFQEPGAPVTKPEELDVLLVDAEGMDADVVNAFFDIPVLHPALVVFERQHMVVAKRQQLNDRLRAKGYFLWDEDRRNSVAVLNTTSAVKYEVVTS